MILVEKERGEMEESHTPNCFATYDHSLTILVQNLCIGTAQRPIKPSFSMVEVAIEEQRALLPVHIDSTELLTKWSGLHVCRAARQDLEQT